MRITKDLLAGFMFAAFGLATVAISSEYDFGTPAQMGAGFFPMLIGVLLTITGVLIGVQASSNPESSEPVGTWSIKPLTIILIAICSFGLLIERAGLVASLAALILISRLAGRDRGFVEPIVITLVLIGVTVAIFVYGLHIPLKSFGS